MKALIVIDYTNDFIADDGRLTCGAPGQSIERAVSSAAQTFMERGDFTVFAVDVHDETDHYHPENRLFPPHNIRGTKGRDLYGSVHALYEGNRHEKHVYWMDKTRYSAFAGTDLEIKLRERGITDVYLAGVCTDICVLHTAVDAYNKGFQLHVYEDAVQSFNEQGHDWALSHFQQSLGVRLVTAIKERA
ncbi:cysteine hydrolase family protein [Fictibacillus iocasae]|uniref:Cysteine hydrolase family protein n=1 Tax=Fictibacillus iocasae TaxID=2715437 RepID=A0ABW2NJ25_9BACL